LISYRLLFNLIKEEMWRLKLYIILLAVLILITNPKVLELFGKLLGLIK